MEKSSRSGVPSQRFDHDRHAPGAIARARHLRKNQTLGEKRLWEELRKLKLHIRRQAPIGKYVADFAHHGAWLVIEVDSPWHDGEEAQLRDAERDAWLQSQGYVVLRFRDEALTTPEIVAEQVGAQIAARLGRPKASAPFPSMGKGRDGVEAPDSTGRRPLGPSAHLRLSPQHQASTPTPAPPPSRGRGSSALDEGA
jgi:very-short-patch-repair endonuclease